ncbi:Nif11-like leader peptide family natural product precursor [Pseudodesulfovibrio indicus]|uniref:Nif11-like leader peptide family natural product precursor n=1 Tax=Pseudodesulfovibrio indicus TaxID=1716143 RepID=UPI0029301019|nr:Nif11-like leader peptide family natural product precursor [Pseudodesulfovibrio indicus]
MSREELSRLIGDAMADPGMIQDAMNIKDRPSMAAYVRDKGYTLTPEELDEIWELAARALSGSADPEGAARWRMDTVGGATLNKDD